MMFDNETMTSFLWVINVTKQSNNRISVLRHTFGCDSAVSVRNELRLTKFQKIECPWVFPSSAGKMSGVLQDMQIQP